MSGPSTVFITILQLKIIASLFVKCQSMLILRRYMNAWYTSIEVKGELVLYLLERE